MKDEVRGEKRKTSMLAVAGKLMNDSSEVGLTQFLELFSLYSFARPITSNINKVGILRPLSLNLDVRAFS